MPFVLLLRYCVVLVVVLIAANTDEPRNTW